MTLQQPVRVHGVEVPLAASIGGAICLDGSTDAATLLAAADAAMYDAKGTGRGLRLRVIARGEAVPLP